MKPRHVVFVVNLLQDINILRPLAYMAARDLGSQTLFLVTAAFRKRDKSGTWQKELADIAQETHAGVVDFDHEFEALLALRGMSGVMVAGSESHLAAHQQVHDLFRTVPGNFLKVTLQHGFECVGFLQSRDQNLAHGTQVTFAADVICGWCDPERLVSVAPSQRHKLLVTGPTAVLQMPDRARTTARAAIGLVCENMHSPRLNVAGDFKTDFLDIFGDYCAALKAQGSKVALRPHPGGQYTLKNNVSLSDNVEIHNAPIYKVDLTQYAYGISAPSSILIDMMLAGIPVAVWQDQGSVMDLGNYEGLTRISSLDDWLDFTRQALTDPDRFVRLQNDFLERQKLHVGRDDVYRQYADLLGIRLPERPATMFRPEPAERILFVANGHTPTLQLSFLRPLATLVAAGEVAVDVISEIEMNRLHKHPGIASEQWLLDRFAAFRPTTVVFSRYSGPHVESMLDYLAQRKIPAIFHIDDDLLGIPRDIGTEKYYFHNQPERLEAIRYLLDHATLVYCSTPGLRKRLEQLSPGAPVVAGDIYCAGIPMRDATNAPVRTVGYMGIGHESDFRLAIPALVSYLRKHGNVKFEIFGTIPIPEEFDEFAGRISHVDKCDDYGEFLRRLSELEWDIGICPLAATEFNMVKADTKWVEYTAVGAAVIASRNTIYDGCCADGCGILAGPEEEWVAALEALTNDPQARARMVSRAQERLRRDYSIEALRVQVLDIIERARRSVAVPVPADETAPAAAPATASPAVPAARRERVLYVANSMLATLQLSFMKPLQPLVATGDVVADYLTEDQIKQEQWKAAGFGSQDEWIIDRFRSFRPTLLVFCRYSGIQSELMLRLARELDVPSIYHIDDDLLNIPPEIGEGKFIFHNKPPRIEAVTRLIEGATLVYCSTDNLLGMLRQRFPDKHVVAGGIYCSGTVINAAVPGPVRKMGYMASVDHAHNLALVTGAIVKVMRECPELGFEFFGSIPAPAEFAEFRERITFAPKVSDYEQFLQCFAERQWDIGICPLSPIAFNLMKADTKWVEYTAAGVAVVASKGTVYDRCCADGCGILADGEAEWHAALGTLARDPEARYRQALRAQEKLARDYSTERLRQQVLEVFARAHDLHDRSTSRKSSS